MTCSPTINDDLLEFWPMLEGPGASVAIGEIRGIPLALQRTDRDTNEVLPAGEGWTTETGSARAAYNGAGVAEIEAGLLGIAEIGDGLTLAVRFWRDGGRVVQGGEDLAGDIQCVGLRGYSSPDPGTLLGVLVSTAGLALSGAVGGVAFLPGIGGGTFVFSDIELPEGPALLVVTFRRVEGDVVNVQAWVDGEEATGDGVTVGIDYPLLTTLVYGDAIASDCAFGAAAVWSRVLTDEEIESLGDSLDCLSKDEGGEDIGDDGDENDDPIIWGPGDDGTPWGIDPEWPCRRLPATADCGVLASEGEGGRHTRRTHERGRLRRYAFPFNLADARQVNMLREALAVTRGGALTTPFRHPIDDPPGPVSTAPRVRIVNAYEAGMAIARGGRGGGAIGQFELVIEYADL